MKFSKGTFWDVDETTFDYEKHAGHIILRVFMRGTFEDLLEVLRYYGKDRVRDVLVQTRYLDKKTLAFASSYFHVPKEEFRCYKRKQFIPQLWDY